jgi:hypothetical protein
MLGDWNDLSMTHLLNYIDYWTREEHSCKNTLREIKVHCLFVFVTPVSKKGN